MSEITTATTSKAAGVKKVKRLSTRVDLTPMVDLGFLLITFFIFTTSMSQPKAMNLVMHSDQNVKDPSKHQDEKTLSLILGDDNKVYFYHGIFNGRIEEISYSSLRDVLLQKKENLLREFGSDKDLLILIKPGSTSSFKNLVDVLDEMLINEVRLYMVVELTLKEEEAIILVPRNWVIEQGDEMLDINMFDWSDETYIINAFNCDTFLKSFKIIK